MTDLEIEIRKILDDHYAQRDAECDDNCLCYRLEYLLMDMEEDE
jgi:hypothetical protein